jgi:hypothetical protein
METTNTQAPKTKRPKAILTATRECTQCHEAKPLPAAFYKLADLSGGLDGYTKRCKDCYKASRGSGKPRLAGKPKAASKKGTLVNFTALPTGAAKSKRRRSKPVGVPVELPAEAFKNAKATTVEE